MPAIAGLRVFRYRPAGNGDINLHGRTRTASDLGVHRLLRSPRGLDHRSGPASNDLQPNSPPGTIGADVHVVARAVRRAPSQTLQAGAGRAPKVGNFGHRPRGLRGPRGQPTARLIRARSIRPRPLIPRPLSPRPLSPRPTRPRTRRAHRFAPSRSRSCTSATVSLTVTSRPTSRRSAS